MFIIILFLESYSSYITNPTGIYEKGCYLNMQISSNWDACARQSRFQRPNFFFLFFLESYVRHVSFYNLHRDLASITFKSYGCLYIMLCYVLFYFTLLYFLTNKFLLILFRTIEEEEEDEVKKNLNKEKIRRRSTSIAVRIVPPKLKKFLFLKIIKKNSSFFLVQNINCLFNSLQSHPHSKVTKRANIYE